MWWLNNNEKQNNNNRNISRVNVQSMIEFENGKKIQFSLKFIDFCTAF